MKYLIFSLVFVVFSNLAYAQNIKGKIVDNESLEALGNCVILYKKLDQNNIQEKIADEHGDFSINVEEGIYEFIFNYIGYIERRDTITFISSTNLTQNFSLIQSSIQGIHPIIRANLIPASNVLKINKDNFLKLSGSFNDPSRLLLKFPTISSTNDQANFISLKGMPPAMSGWFINGASIVNPNHLSNTGTFSDQASANGGGVNMISGYGIGNFEFIQSPLNSDYFNIGSGLSNFELEIEKGGRFTLGLLGTEFGYGYDKQNLQIGANYRYSTLGILSTLGIPLGDEKINFQDFHARFSRKTKEFNWSVDVLIGNSSNIHESLAENSVYYKDALFIALDQRQEIISTKFDVIKEKYAFKNTINFSRRKALREIISDDLYSPIVIDSTETINEQRISSANIFTYYFNNIWSIKYSQNINAGIIKETNYNGIYSKAAGLFSLKYNKNNLILEGGYGGSIIGNKINKEEEWLNNYGSEIRFLFQYGNNKNRFRGQASSGLVEVLPEIVIRGTDIVPMKNINMSIDYMQERNWGKVKIGGYYHIFNNVLVSEKGLSYFSRYDLLKSTIDSKEYNLDGNANIIGGLFLYQLNFKSFQILQSFSSYKMNISEEIESDFDFGHTYSSTISYTKEIKENELIISTTLQGRGGNKEFIIDEDLSELNSSTIYNFNERKTLSPYSRVDLKISYLWGKRINDFNRHSISIDIQNLLNRRNDSYSFYDPLVNEIILGNQLGIIPILSYNLRF